MCPLNLRKFALNGCTSCTGRRYLFLFKDYRSSTKYANFFFNWKRIRGGLFISGQNLRQLSQKWQIHDRNGALSAETISWSRHVVVLGTCQLCTFVLPLGASFHVRIFISPTRRCGIVFHTWVPTHEYGVPRCFYSFLFFVVLRSLFFFAALTEVCLWECHSDARLTLTLHPLLRTSVFSNQNLCAWNTVNKFTPGHPIVAILTCALSPSSHWSWQEWQMTWGEPVSCVTDKQPCFALLLVNAQISSITSWNLTWQNIVNGLFSSISVSVVARKMIGVTEIKKASSYGKTEINANDKKQL